MKSENRASSCCGDETAVVTKGRWNPYAVGVGIGILSWAAFAIVNKPLGISTALSSVSGVCAIPAMGSEAVQHNPYWARHPFAWNGGMLFLVGTLLGSLLSVLASGTFRVEKVPAVWKQFFGPSTARRMVGAFLGGILLMYGARMAGGCTSGHGISGSLQLALSSWVFFLVMFAFGVLGALFLFRKRSHNQ